MNEENDVEISEKGKKKTHTARSKCRYYIEMQKNKRKKRKKMYHNVQEITAIVIQNQSK